MILAAHQPNYLPWLGLLHKIASSDVFVLADHVQYEKQGFQNRNRIKTHDGAKWLTVPVRREGRDRTVSETRIADDDRWRRQTFRTIETAYCRAPHFRVYAEPIAAIYNKGWERLIDLNNALLQVFLDCLEIRTPIILGSSLSPEGKKTEMIVDLCRLAGADTYLSGRGGSIDYLDRALLSAAGIRLAWQEFTHPVYPQLHPQHGFLANLSVLDLLFNCGPDSRQILLGASADNSANYSLQATLPT